MDRKEVERQAVAIRMTALDGGKRAAGGGSSNGGGAHLANGAAASGQDAGTLHDLENAGKSLFTHHVVIGLSSCCRANREYGEETPLSHRSVSRHGSMLA